MRYAGAVKVLVALVMAGSLLVLWGTLDAFAERTVTAKKVKKGPVIDGKVDKVWRKVRASRIPVKEGKIGDITVTMKALYDSEYVYFLFRWPDKTMSQNRVYVWTGEGWKKRKGNEDRLGLLWDIKGNLKDFGTKGCDAICHKEKKGDKEIFFMKADSPDQRGDVWHWKAQRSNPVGYADDQYLQHVVASEGEEKTGRKGDKKTAGSYKKNWDKKRKAPKFIHKAGKWGPVLLKKDAVPLKPGTSVEKGAVVPREVLERPVGSRGDIDAGGRYAKGRWTLELRRKLRTGNPDDVQFDTSKSYFFGLAIFDNTSEKEHSFTKGEAYKLVFK
ncbi:MAG: ethylbenzene dehydrogenase-related protein [Nitrospinota bacterium]